MFRLQIAARLVGAAVVILALSAVPASALLADGPAKRKDIRVIPSLLQVGKKTERFDLLEVRAPRGSRIAITCSPRTLCRSWSRAKTTKKVTKFRGIAKKTVRKGMRIVVRVTRPNGTGSVITLTVTRAKPPADLESDEAEFGGGSSGSGPGNPGGNTGGGNTGGGNTGGGNTGGGTGADPTKDTDNDTVIDAKDECPSVAGKPTLAGCPDKDNDNIRDSADDCPAAAGPAKFAGCPDTDNDGLRDRDDSCPTEAGKLTLPTHPGCPDPDNDNIRSADDRCPAEAGPAFHRGCPDSDGDGIANVDDDCDGEVGPAAHSGCPDGDGDGLRNSQDACPSQPGGGNPEGCPAPSCPAASARLKRGVFHDYHGGRRVGISGNWTSVQFLTKSFGSAYNYSTSQPFDLRSDGLWRIWIPANNDPGTTLTFTYRVFNTVSSAFCDGTYTITVTSA